MNEDLLLLEPVEFPKNWNFCDYTRVGTHSLSRILKLYLENLQHNEPYNIDFDSNQSFTHNCN